ncbi:MAG: DNA gyrase subunit A [Candidatus Pacebacteria bacterium]|nr:DNA gyrase subunit A [Candidatus Paceibacterota bacterium]
MVKKESKKIQIKTRGIKLRNIVTEMQESYIDYAMSVIISRALPDTRDGLKPVQRRILYTMYEMGLRHNAKFRKSATVVGSTLGHYHPHGDSAVYAAMARMAQDFSLRYPLVHGQGNFGSLDNDPPAAQRYTEAKLSKIGEEMLKDIEKDSVNFVPNFDGTNQEPTVLPSPLPQLLLNGTLGIAVGMATNIPPHNLSEICDASIHLLLHPKANTEDLFQFVKGPDFPTGGIIYDKNEILSAYSQGKGSIVIRGKAEIVEKKDDFQVVISEIPFGVQKSNLVKQIAKLVQDKKIQGVKDLRDESDRDGLRVVIDLKKISQPRRILNFLYKWTSLQASFHLNMISLADGIQPKTMNLVEMLAQFIEHRKQVIVRRTKFDLKQAKERCHILEGFDKALRNIDAVIKVIKASQDRTDAQKNLIKKFKLTAIQSNAILEMKLSALAKLEQKKVQDQLKQIKELIKKLTEILKSPAKIKNIIKKELEEYKNLFGDPRRTKVVSKKVGDMSFEDLVPQEPTVITLTQKGFIKRVNPSILRVQQRGGKGILGQKTSGEDVVEHLIFTNTHDHLLFFTDSGKVFKTRVFEVPEAKRVARGKNLLNFLDLSSEEKVLELLPLSNDETEIKYFVMATKNGIVKKTVISDFDNVRRNGLIAINLRKGDSLKSVRKSNGNDHVILITKKGKSIKFGEKDVRAMGRNAAGVKGIKLRKEDEVIAMGIIKKEQDKEKKNYLLVISENGYGKRTLASEYRSQKRGGTGIKTANITKKTGDLVSAKMLNSSEEHLISISKKGQVIKINISSISKMGRSTQGVRLMRLGDKDKVASIAVI